MNTFVFKYDLLLTGPKDTTWIARITLYKCDFDLKLSINAISNKLFSASSYHIIIW